MEIKENRIYKSEKDVVTLEWYDSKTVWLRRDDENIIEFDRNTFEKTFKLVEHTESGV